MNLEFSYTFPAIKGIQARREYYSFMCPLPALEAIFASVEDQKDPENYAQRTLNNKRVDGLIDYVEDNPEDYTLSSLTLSVDRSLKFEPVNADCKVSRNVGSLTVSMDCNFSINDGQHRFHALKRLIKREKNYNLKYEHINIILYIDRGLEKRQQKFSDLNRYTAKPTKSLSILYDHRDDLAKAAVDISKAVPYFKGMVEFEKNSLSKSSKKLFCLSHIYEANSRLLGKSKNDSINEDEKKLLTNFWTTVGDNIEHWYFAKTDVVATSDLRLDYIHAHAVALQALANVGASILNSHKIFDEVLTGLQSLDWRRSNSAWEGRAMIAGSMNKSQNNIILTGNLIKKHLGLDLTPSEERVEYNFNLENDDKI